MDFMASRRGRGRKQSTGFSQLFEPGYILNTRLKNRLVMPAIGTGFAADSGAVSEKMIDYYSERARGGVGLITVEACAVDRRLSGKGAGQLSIDDERYVAGHAELVEAVHSYGAKIALQLMHPGRHATPETHEGYLPVAPSPMPESVRPLAASTLVPRELIVEEIELLIEEFASAARRAKRAGYDAIEIHGAHGYLIHQFLSRRSNRRTDAYGGSIESRMRFATKIVKRVKEMAGGNLPVIFRLTAEETAGEGGYTLEEGKHFAGLAQAAGANAIHVTMGTFEDVDGISRNTCPMSFPQGWRVPYAEAIKGEVNIPVIVVGVFREPEIAEEVLEQGKADFVALGRALIADPQWPHKTFQGRTEDIRKCTSCNYCLHHLSSGLPLRCAVNAEVGREREFVDLRPAAARKKVMIVGSGPAGMEAARVAYLRGHDVQLYEKGSELGTGQLMLSTVAPGKEKMHWLRNYLINQIRKLSIKLHLETEVSTELVKKARPDVLIVATGARPLVPYICGMECGKVVTAHDVLAGKVNIRGEKVVVLGGWSTGCETAHFLAENGNEVTIVARSSSRHLARGTYASNRFELISKLRSHPRVAIRNEYDVKQISPKGVTIIDKDERESFLEAFWVVLARGVESVKELANKAEDTVPEVYVVGDACDPRDIASAIYEGGLVARRI